MRIPTSVIVMSLLTAAPFGLAIRDTLKHQEEEVGDEELGFDPRSRARRARVKKEMEQYEREARLEAEREAEARALRDAERRGKLDMLFGEAPGSMGSLLQGIVLGADASSFQPEAARVRIAEATRDGFLNVLFDVDAKSLNAVTIEVSRGDDYDASEGVCDVLRAKLDAAWGRASASTWRDPETGQRASLDPDSCSLTFDRALATAAWVAALPFDAIGRPAEKFVESLGPAVEADDESAVWFTSGVGMGVGQTRLEAYFDKGKVAGIKVLAFCDAATVDQVREGLGARVKSQPKVDEETGAYEWKRKVPVRLDPVFSANRMRVMIGKIPWE